MAENNNFINVGGRLHSIATGNVLAGTDEIYDDGKGKKQSTINAETDAILAQHTSVIQGLNSQNYETYAATNQTTAVTDVLPATGNVNTVYRLGNWDGNQFDPSCYTEYSWDGTQYVPISTKTQTDEVFDISAYHASGDILATYADLSAALDSNNGGGVPQSLQRGGMSIKFVCSSDNKYVQYRLMSNTFSTTESDWQGVDNEPTTGSENLVKSGGVYEKLFNLESKINTKLTDLIHIYGDWYTDGNSIYIDMMCIYGADGKIAKVYTIKQTFNVPQYTYLVFDYSDETIKVVGQRLRTTDMRLLLVGAENGFEETGELYHYLLRKEMLAQTDEINNDIKVSRNQYALLGNSYIDNNYVYIDILGVIFPDGKLAKEYEIKQGFNVTQFSYLVFDTINNTVNLKGQLYATPTDDILLMGDKHGFYTGKLYSQVQKLTLNTYSVKIDLIGESMWVFNDGGGGTVYEPCDTNPAQLTSMQTQNYLSFDRRFDYFVGVSGVDNKLLYIFLYDENFEFIKWLKFADYTEGTDIDAAIDDTRCRYIKLTIQNSDLSEFKQSLYNVSISVKSKKEPKWYFNGFGKNNSIQFRTYEINKPYITDNCSVKDGNSTTNYRGENVRRFNWGYIILPENYTVNGKPVPVIIHCHGTSGVVFNQQSLPYNTKYLQFLAKCGYAVIGCSTFSNEYRDETDDGNFPTPLAMSCYENLWNYMTNGYNLDKTRAYIFGYSAGGMNTILFSQSKVFPIRAAASLAGSVDLVSNMRILADFCNEFFYKQIGLGEVDLPTGLATDGIRMHPMKNEVTQQIIDNWDKFVGLNPFCFNSDLDYKAFLQKYSTLYNKTSSLEADTELNEMIEKSKVYFNMPIKFWYAVDDVNVPIQMARWWCRMVKNGGGLCYMREFPSGCGAHYAVGYTGNESKTPMVDYKTPFGETINIPVAYAELVDWFKRW